MNNIDTYEGYNNHLGNYRKSWMLETEGIVVSKDFSGNAPVNISIICESGKNNSIHLILGSDYTSIEVDINEIEKIIQSCRGNNNIKGITQQTTIFDILEEK